MDRLLTTAGPLLAALALAAAAISAGPARAADAGMGKSLFNAQCGVCHSGAKGGGTLIGPNLFGVVGRPAGSVKGYAYSAEMKRAGVTWTNSELTTYLAAPTQVLPGVKMAFAGVKNPVQLANLVAYLDTLK